MNGIGAVAGKLQDAVLSQGQGTSNASAGMPFGGMMRAMIEQTSALDQKASQAVAGVMNGQGVEIHDALIATQKADVGFELALQVRNKAVAAYQQMMNMQF